MALSVSSAGLYIHIPFCLAKCDYCDFFSIPCSGCISNDYIESLLIQAEYYVKLYNITEWKTIYIGGGTPSLLSDSQLSSLLSGLYSLVKNKKSLEVTVEMNPETISQAKIESCLLNGVNRFSVGIQSMNQNALRLVNRHCNVENNEKALDLILKIRKANPFLLNLDCIAGLPGCSDKDFINSLKKILSYEPDHLSMYTLTVEEDTKLYSNINNKIVKFDCDDADNQWLNGKNILNSYGFEQYEVSNFCKKGSVSVHNMLYWSQENYIGLGSGATGTVYDFENGKALRWTGITDVSKYISCIKENKYEDAVEKEYLDCETMEFEYLMMGFRTTKGISQSVYKDRYSSILPWNGNIEDRLGVQNGIWKKFSEENKTFLYNDLQGNKCYSLNSEGLLFLNNFLLEL